MVIYHRPGSKHHTADFLSRLKEEDTCQQFRHTVKPDVEDVLNVERNIKNGVSLLILSILPFP